MITIGGLQKLTLIDYPGKLACTVFVVGCSFRCPWCYNSQLVLPEKQKSQIKISPEDLFKFLKDRRGMLEGCVIGGGEPTIYSELSDFCKRIKSLGYAVKLDTNGSNPALLQELINKELIDYVAMDIKAPREKYLKTVGLDESSSKLLGYKVLENIEKSINILKEGKVDYEFRTTVVPRLIDKTDILQIVRWISPAGKYFLQDFRPENTNDPSFQQLEAYPRPYLLEILKAIAPFFEICHIR